MASGNGAAGPSMRIRGANARRILSCLAAGIILIGWRGCSPQTSQTPAVRFVREIAWSGRGEWLKADTHIHTRFSDGRHPVSEVAAQAVAHGCNVIAITDHADRGLRAATPEYAEAVEVARRQHPELTILAGLEWNVPPWGGDAHATVLLPSSPDEFLLLAEFKDRFDDLNRPQHDAALADEALRWLKAAVAGPVAPVVFSNHPSRKTQTSLELVDRIRHWRSVNEIVAGFSGAPGHQAGDPLGAYQTAVELVDRWDPAVARIGGAWDLLLQGGIDVWAARAPSDFHSATGRNVADYWPGQFSETWLYVPERSAAGVLQSFRAGSFFAAHGHIVREVQLTVSVPGLPRAARSGEHVEVPPQTEVQLGLVGRVPTFDWNGDVNRLDEIEFIVVPAAGEPRVIRKPVARSSRLLETESLSVPAGGLVVRARGRRIIDDGPDLLFYTNPIRISTSNEAPASPAGKPAPGGTSWSMRSILGTGILVLVLLSAVAGICRRRRGWRTLFRSKRRRTTARIPTDPASVLVSDGRFPGRGHYLLAATFFLFVAVYGSLVPLHFRPLDFDEALDRFANLPYFRPDLGARADWVANILLFIPIGLFCTAAGTLDRPGRLRNLVYAGLTALGCAALSVGLEFTQLWFPPRTVSQNDVMAQFVGGFTGILLWFAVGPPLTDWLRMTVGSRQSRSQADWLLQAYVLGLLIYSVMPLDLTIHPVELYRKYREGKVVLLPFANSELTAVELWNRLTDMLVFVPVGVYSARRWWNRDGELVSLRQRMAIGAALVVLVEVVQFFVYSRVTETGDILCGLLGVGIGAALVHRRTGSDASYVVPSARERRRVARRWAAASAGYALGLCFLFWWPFDWNSDPADVARQLKGFFRAPFAAMYWGTEFNAVTEVLRKTLLFGVLGALLARWVDAHDLPKRVRRLFLKVAFVSCLLLGTVIELGQAFWVTHIPDVTDVMLYALGAAFGLLIAKRIRIENIPSAGGFAPSSAPAPMWTAGATTTAVGFGIVVLLVAAFLQFGVQFNSVKPTSESRNDEIANSPQTTAKRSGTAFTALPSDPFATPALTRVPIPAFPGADSVWGATGRNQQGRIWFGVSASDVPVPSAHLFEFDPQSGRTVDWGDVVTALKDAGLHRSGEGQMKIHTKIIEADDGHLYFASMDEEGEEADGSRLPMWGSHLWRLRRPSNRWEHLRAVPQGLIALSSDGRWISALGYFDHVLFQYDTATDEFRSVAVGAAEGHVSRNFLTDGRGHVFVPRVTPLPGQSGSRRSERLGASLVEYDIELRAINETPLSHYIDDGQWSFHGITGFTPMADGAIAFTTSVGFLYRIVPSAEGPAAVEPVGWFHPKGKTYAPSLFTFSGARYLCGITRRSKQYDWVVYDLERGRSLATPLPLDQVGLKTEDLLLYGSVTRDDAGAFYVGGKSTTRGNGGPVLLRLQVPGGR